MGAGRGPWNSFLGKLPHFLPGSDRALASWDLLSGKGLAVL